ncbi:phospho-sugar mutase [Convivina praedatoris]|uniref:Phosphoglucomutase n=1 Tax=Convivina praedatoris TaxID=2880963 RepID=A0ABN8HA09_9LACO|nr:phospho-sugar mutase [Convivina sp. LMG 32447]CAH1854159.1 Phosphoglucomutase [Convivina sp. LMG 32447]CAH1855397.1 Phosphoglucomutase [Convivina sp. LMG 32447]CAH1855496.1 Phosphoglucomutase [Convivina sp. LMG 32447]
MTQESNLQKWQAASLPVDLAQELAAYTPAEQEDAFYQDLSFGTAGMRGLMGPGSNRMNIYTVRQVTEALARFIDDQGAEAKKRGVVISFDSRHHSQEFAQETARVLSQHGIHVYLFSSLRPTPELSFSVRYLKAFAGVMVTASHNPKEYNGYKVYGEDGGQMVPDAVAAVVAKRAEIQDIFTIATDEKEANVDIVDDQLDNAYLKEMKTVTVDPALVAAEGSQLKFIYSPLHGTGQYIGEKALQQAGFTNYTIVKEQAILDGDFPTVKKPNPEDPAALALAIEYAKQNGADAVVATDPDADRMGAAVRLANGEYQVLTGNQIAAVLVNYLLTAKKQRQELPDNGAIVTSVVSSRFASTVAQSFGVTTVDVLTGFKYIAEMIDRFEATGEHQFQFGFEESFGYLVKPFAHDKDAIQALVLFAEVAAYYKSKQQTFADGLEELFERYGYFEEKTVSYEFPGQHGHEEMAAIMSTFRQEGPKTIGGQLVLATQDFASQTEYDRDGATKTLPQPKADVLKYWLADGSWVALRPSGTEPKLKLYVGVTDDSAAGAQTKLTEIVNDMEVALKKN